MRSRKTDGTASQADCNSKKKDSFREKAGGKPVMENQSAIEQLRSHVESMIAAGNYAPGTRLPAIRTLAEQFRLTPGTTRRVIKELCDRGLLVLRHGSGTYVRPGNQPAPPGSRTIAVVLWTGEKNDSYCAHAASGVVTEAKCSGYLPRFYYLPYYDHTRTLDLPDELWECGAVIFLGTYDCFELQNFKGNRPCVGVEMHRSIRRMVSPISIDPYIAAELAVDFFRQRRITRVTVAKMHTPLHHIRADAFISLWQQIGRCDIVINRWDIPERPPSADEGFFFCSGTDHNYFLQEMKEKFGDRKIDGSNMLSVDGKSLLLPHYEPVNTLYIDWQLAGRVAFQECLRRLDMPGADVRRIYLAPQLHLSTETRMPSPDIATALPAGAGTPPAAEPNRPDIG